MPPSSVYPNALDVISEGFADATFTKGVHAEHHDLLASAIKKTQAELGVNPSGSSVDVATLLALLSGVTHNVLDPQFAGGALGTGAPEPSAPFQNAYLAATTLGGSVVVPAGTYYINDPTLKSVWQLARDNARTGQKVHVILMPGATIRHSTLTPRLVDFNRQDPFDWFRNIEFIGYGATIDANNVAGIHHLLIGTLQDGAVQQYINYERIYFRGIRVINLYTDATDGTLNLRHAAWLSPLGHTTTDTYGNFVEFEDIDIAGGHGGITIGNAGAGSKFHWDQQWIRRCRHDRGRVDETVAGADSFYIGSRGVGQQGGMIDCTSIGAPDTAFEINGVAEGYVERCLAIDPKNNGFLHRGAAGGIDPADPASFTEFNDCSTRKVLRTGSMRHIKFGVDTAGDFAYGTVRVNGGGCGFERTDNADVGAIAASSPNSYRAIIFNEHDVVIKAGPASANTSGVNLITSVLNIDRGNSGLFKIRGFRVRLEGAVGVGAGISRRIIDARGIWQLNWDGLQIDDQQTFTGGTPSLRGVAIGTSLNASGAKSALWGRIRNMRYAAIGGGPVSTAIDYGAFATQDVGVTGRMIDIDGLDCVDMTAASLPVAASGVNLKTIRARNVMPRGTFAFPSVASAATLGLPAYDVPGETITVTGTVNVTTITASWPGRVVRLQVTGAATFTDNGTTLNLAGNFTGPGYLILLCDSVGNWVELGQNDHGLLTSGAQPNSSIVIDPATGDINIYTGSVLRGVIKAAGDWDILKAFIGNATASDFAGAPINHQIIQYFGQSGTVPGLLVQATRTMAKWFDTTTQDSMQANSEGSFFTNLGTPKTALKPVVGGESDAVIQAGNLAPGYGARLIGRIVVAEAQGSGSQADFAFAQSAAAKSARDAGAIIRQHVQYHAEDQLAGIAGIVGAAWSMLVPRNIHTADSISIGAYTGIEGHLNVASNIGDASVTLESGQGAGGFRGSGPFVAGQVVQIDVGTKAEVRTIAGGGVVGDTLTFTATLSKAHAHYCRVAVLDANSYGMWYMSGGSLKTDSVIIAQSAQVIQTVITATTGIGYHQLNAQTGGSVATPSVSTSRIYLSGQKIFCHKSEDGIEAPVRIGHRRATAVDLTLTALDAGICGVTSTATARFITLPAANAVPAGWEVTVKDESGAAATNNITVQRAGTDTIEAGTTKVINTNYGVVTLYSDGATKWFVR